jgi:uncharacterized membrane protein
MSPYKSTNYPSIVGSVYGWWHKPIESSVAFIIMVVLVIMIFLLGIWFTTQYMKIWSVMQVNAQAQQEESPNVQYIK